MTAGWCEVLGIEKPSLESAKDHREANTYSLLLVALLEHGEPMTLEQVAARFERAGVATAARALASLRRCRPGRAPIYCDGENYAPDPHDDAASLWVFRLGLRPPRVPSLRVVRPESPPLPGVDVALTPQELDQAWTGASLYSWSTQRLALAVLDAHAGALKPAEIDERVAARTRWYSVKQDAGCFTHRGSPISVLPDGRWAVSEAAGKALQAARRAVRARVEKERQRAASQPDPAVHEAYLKRSERRRAEHAKELAGLSRAVLAVFPAQRPQALALIDVGRHQIDTYLGDEIALALRRLADFDVIGGLDVRATLRALGFDPGAKRLAELGPPQKTLTLNKQGRKLKITSELLITSSCGISRPLGDAKKLEAYLREGKETKLRRRLAADAKSLYALYEYGRLHGGVRVKWGFLDDGLSVPWSHFDEPRLHHWLERARLLGMSVELIVGSAPGWDDPWSRVRRATVEKQGWQTWVIDEAGAEVRKREIQRVRLAGGLPW